MNLAETPPRGGTTKFTYASGSRPLDGYTIKRGIGRGGFGEVYFAVSDAGKEVALKLVRRNLDVELRGVQQCLNLKHPNLVDLYDIRHDEHGDPWVVMEYVPGECLEDAIGRHPTGLPARDGPALVPGHGLRRRLPARPRHRPPRPEAGQHLHRRGTVKIGDYGLSKFISASRRSGQTESVGTVHYMAPEIANGHYGKEIDIYALGVMLYEMLTGHVPFEGESVGEVLMKHLTAQPDLSKVEERYRGAVARALTKDPQQRFASVGEFLAAIGLVSGTSGSLAHGGTVGAGSRAASPPAPRTAPGRVRSVCPPSHRCPSFHAPSRAGSTLAAASTTPGQSTRRTGCPWRRWPWCSGCSRA